MSTSRRAALAVTLISSLAFSVSASQAAPPDGKGKSGNGKKKDNDPISIDVGLSARISVGISIGDARVLASNHGITGSKPLPPGIRKNMARGKPMPPGIRKTRMPESFINELPRHDGYEWQQAGADLVLVANGSLIISDILEGVFD